MQKKAIVVNCSAPHYNLGALKCSDWLISQGYSVTYSQGDPGLWSYDAELVCLSVIFSWHAPIAREVALRMKDRAEIWCGGPGIYALATWWRNETGLEIVRGLDTRFDRQRGQYKMCFASRGCPVGCYFCLVPKLEGITFSFDPEFIPSAILCDNNLSALPDDYQDHIIQRYRAFHQPLKDPNSGFEPAFFTEETYRRWKPLLDESYAPWRFALDEMRELESVQRMLHILKDEAAMRKRVYCLIGNETIQSCYERACKIIEGGGEPHCQFVLPLNLLDNPRQPLARVKVRDDWSSYQAGRDFMRYYNRRLWRNLPIWEYRPRKGEAPPFAQLEPVIKR